MNRVQLLRTSVFAPAATDRKYIGYSVLLDGVDIGYVYRQRMVKPSKRSAWSYRGAFGMSGDCYPRRQSAVDALVTRRILHDRA